MSCEMCLSAAMFQGPTANIIFIEKLTSLAPHKQIFAHLMDAALHEELYRS